MTRKELAAQLTALAIRAREDSSLDDIYSALDELLEDLMGDDEFDDDEDDDQ